jgi:hypothetical protein
LPLFAVDTRHKRHAARGWQMANPKEIDDLVREECANEQLIDTERADDARRLLCCF